MTGIVLSFVVLLATTAGAAWILSPLLRRSIQPTPVETHIGDVALDRSLRLLDDLQADFERGAISQEDFAVVSRDIRREAAQHLHERHQFHSSLDPIIESLVSGGRTPLGSLTAAPRRHGPLLAWIGPGITLIAVLTTLVVAITVGARDAMQEQSVVGNVGVTAMTGMAIANDQPDILIVTHATGTVVSQNGGQTWESADVAGSALGAMASSSLLYVLTTDGASASADGGRTWNQAPSLPELRLVTSGYRSGYMAGITADGTLVMSTNMGSTWSTIPLEPPPGVSSLAIVDFEKPFLLVATQTEGVLAYTDGKDWRSANGFVNGALPTVVAYSIIYAPETNDQFTSSTGERFKGAVFVATDGGVFKSIDGMQSWQSLSLRADIRSLGHSPVRPRTLFAIAANGAVYRSDDAGNTWQ